MESERKICRSIFPGQSVNILNNVHEMIEETSTNVPVSMRAVTRALIGGRGEYSYICVLPDEFLLKSVVIRVDFKRNSSDRARIYMNIHPPPPYN